MKNPLRIATLALTLLSATAFANHCPMDMKKIDAALSASPSVPPADLAEAKRLRAEGEKLHASGDHAGSVEALGKAMKLLKI